MDKNTKTWLLIAALLILIGSVLFAAAMTANRWDFSKLNTVEYETNTYEFSDPINNISILTDTADILFVHGGSKSMVVCQESKSMRHQVTVTDGTLTISQSDDLHWTDHIGISTGAPKITVYLPDTQYQHLLIAENTGDIHIPEDFSFHSVEITTSTGDIENYASAAQLIKIRTSTGDIRLEALSADTISLAVSTGDIHLANVQCGSFVSEGSTGDIDLINVTAEERISIVSDTGDVTFDHCDAADIFVKTDTGHVKGSLNSGKMFTATSDTGKVDVPQSSTGGKCAITTDTGNIKITVN